MPTDYRMGFPVVESAFQPLIAYVNTLKVGLFKQAAIPADWEDIAEYDQPTNSGYALVTPFFMLVEPPAGPVYHALSSPIEWTANTSQPQEMIRGWFCYDEVLDQVVLVLLYGSDQPFIRSGPFWIEADLSTFFTFLA